MKLPACMPGGGRLVAAMATAMGMACSGGRSAPPRSAAEVTRLRWIEGTWRGTGDVEAPFYERYHFENDSTLVENGLDSTLAVEQDTSRFELRNGRFGNPRWQATALTADSVVFVGSADPTRTFRWRREGKDAWTAVIGIPARAGRPAGQRIYHMERWPR